MSSFSDRFKILRKRLGVSQAQLAKIVGVSQSLVDQIENKNQAGSKHINAFARAFGVHPDWLLTHKGSIDEPYPYAASSTQVTLLPLININQIDKYQKGDQKLTKFIKEICMLPLEKSIAEESILLKMPDSSMFSSKNEANSVAIGSDLIIHFPKKKRPKLVAGELYLINAEGKNKIRMLKKDKYGLSLVPLNLTYKSYASTECKILGVVLASYKKSKILK